MLKTIFAILLSLPTYLLGLLNLHKSTDSHLNHKPFFEKVSFYDLEAVDIHGKTIKMSHFKGKKVIIINVASKCWYTNQYAIWQKYYLDNDGKVAILGFPCNQFMGQEPGSNQEIEQFCTLNYGVTFPMFEKVDVKGKNKSSVYDWLTDQKKNGWNSTEPSWNFCKYIIDENGKLTHYFDSKVTTENTDFLKAMEL